MPSSSRINLLTKGGNAFDVVFSLDDNQSTSQTKYKATLRLNYNFMKPELKDEDAEKWSFKDQVVGGSVAYGIKPSTSALKSESFMRL